nr:unnamed protein product [Digitaria exilis]
MASTGVHRRDQFQNQTKKGKAQDQRAEERAVPEVQWRAELLSGGRRWQTSEVRDGRHPSEAMDLLPLQLSDFGEGGETVREREVGGMVESDRRADANPSLTGGSHSRRSIGPPPPGGAAVTGRTPGFLSSSPFLPQALETRAMSAQVAATLEACAFQIGPSGESRDRDTFSVASSA